MLGVLLAGLHDWVVLLTGLHIQGEVLEGGLAVPMDVFYGEAKSLTVLCNHSGQVWSQGVFSDRVVLTD